MQFGSGERELRIELLPEPEEYGLTGTIEGKTLPGLLGIRLDETPQAERSYEVGALLKLKESKHAVITEDTGTEDTGTVNQTQGRADTGADTGTVLLSCFSCALYLDWNGRTVSVK